MGLFCGLIPGPLQMIFAVIFSVLLRVNLSVAVVTTLYTNPFTIVPLYLMAYKLGAWVTGAHNGVATAKLSFPEMHWHNWMGELWAWLMMLGKPFLIGLPLLALSLAFCGYIAVRVMWRVAVIWKWRSRKRVREI